MGWPEVQTSTKRAFLEHGGNEDTLWTIVTGVVWTGDSKNSPDCIKHHGSVLNKVLVT